MITGMPRIAIATTNFDSLVAACRQTLGLPVTDLTDDHLDTLGARLAMCVPAGGSHIEIMSPAVATAPLSRSLQRFLDRRGQGLFALMLEAPDPDAEAQRLSARGFQVLPRMPDAGGRDIHPHSTLGVLIRIYPVDSFRGKPPLGRPAGPLSGVMRVLIAVRDLDLARAIYGTGLGLATDPPVRDAAGGLAIVRVHPPSGGSIDLVAVRDATRPLAANIERHLAAHGEGMYGLVLQADDPTALLAPLRTAGLEARLAADDPKVVEITRDSPFGALIRIEPASRRCGP
ncbi:MAG: VOC family protein [Microbacteriaceae bacterium]|nr:VOC family protein [Burkholderiaceae bacterium]